MKKILSKPAKLKRGRALLYSVAIVRYKVAFVRYTVTIMRNKVAILSDIISHCEIRL